MEDREKRAMPRLLSVNIGLPRDVAWRGTTVYEPRNLIAIRFHVLIAATQSVRLTSSVSERCWRARSMQSLALSQVGALLGYRTFH